jgi:O-antigen ligase
MFTSLLTRLAPAEAPTSTLARISDRLGIAGLCLFSFFALLGIAGANLGLALMLIALFLSPQAWRQLLHQPLFRLCLLVIGYIALRTIWPPAENAGEPHAQVNQAMDWAWLFLFFVPAWWLSRGPNRIVLSLSLMFSGFALGIISSLDGAALSGLQEGVRSGFHFKKPIIFGFDCAVAILALLVLVFYWLRPGAVVTRTRQTILVGLTILAMLFFTQGLIVSQSRGVWLATLVALPAALLIPRLGREQVHRYTRQHLVALTGILTLSSLMLLLNWNTLTQRLQYESRELGVVISEGLEEAPLGSSTYRLHLWKFGLAKWLERPVLGWGPGTTLAMIDAENDISLKNPGGATSFDHLHNAYLEVLFQLGLAGFVLITAVCALLVWMIIQGYRKQCLSSYLLAFLLSNFVLIAVYSLTDFRHLHWNWRFYWLIIAGISFACSLMANRPAASRA